jgi:hypothetical protein
VARNYFGAGYRTAKSCIFVSHSSKDKDAARRVATAIMAMSVDVYFDEMDDCLKRVGVGDVGVVRCIQSGLDSSSHLLGLITSNTKSSWWVPYEIGGAMGQKKECAHLVTAEVNSLPEYIKAGKVLVDQFDLERWVASIKGTTQDAIREEMRKSAAVFGSVDTLDSILPRVRSGITYY